MSDIECPVCLENIINPYGLSCGHTICGKCFFFLKQHKCPMCSHKIDKNTVAPNLLLETFLRKQIQNYDVLKNDHKADTIAIRNKALYRKSTRYNDLSEKIINLLDENNHYMNIESIQKHFVDTNVNELYHVINLMPMLNVIIIDNITYIINCDTFETVTKFIADKATYFRNNPLVYIHLISTNTGEGDEDEDEDSLHSFAKTIGFDQSIYNKQLLSTSDDWLMDITGLEKYDEKYNEESDIAWGYV